MEKTRANSTEEQLLRQLNDVKIRAYAPAIAFSAIVVVFGIFGNAMSVVFYGFKVPRTSTNTIITVLAAVDLFTSIVLCDEIVELCFTVTFKNVGGCKAMYFFNHSLVLVSVFTLLLVAIDRFRKICRPFAWQYSTLSLKLSFTVIIISAVLLSVRDWAILDVVHVNVTYAERNIRAYYCTHSRAKSMATTFTVFQLMDLPTLLAIVVSTAVLYSCIAKKLWISRRNVRHYKQTVNLNESNVASDNDPIGSPDTDITAEDSFTSIEDQIPNCDKDLSRFVSVHKGVVVCSDVKSYKDNVESDKDTESYGISILRENKLLEKNNKNKPQEDLVANVTGKGDHVRDVAYTNEENVYRHKFRKDEKDVDRGAGLDANNQECKRNSRRLPEAPKIEHKVTLMMFTITVAFLVSFIPYFIVNLWIKQQGNSSAQEFNAGIQIALRSYMLNNAINPYIIGFFNSNFRKFVKSLLCDLRICSLKS